MRGTLIFTAMLLFAAPVALAQEEPTVNDSDYDTSTPEGDDAYLDEAEAESTGEPTVSDADYDTSLPADDDSYLDQAEAEAGGDGTGASSGGDDTPGIALAVMLAALGVAALAWRKK